MKHKSGDEPGGNLGFFASQCMEKMTGLSRAQQDSHFLVPERFRTGHVVQHVTDEQCEDQAEAGIAAALAELQRGELLAEVAPPTGFGTVRAL